MHPTTLRPARRLCRAILLLSAVRAAGGCVAPAPAISRHRTMRAATDQAASGKRLIIVDIFTDWCGWCKEMDRNTWADRTVVAESKRYVFLKVNAETEADGIELQKRFGVQSYPTVLLLDSSGEEFERLEGYLPAQPFLQKLHAAIDDPESLGNLKTREAKEPQNVELRHKLGLRLFKRAAYAEAQARFQKIADQDPENRTEMADSALFHLALCQASTRDTDHALQSLDRLRSRFPASGLVPKASLLEGEILLRSGRRDAARSRIEDFLRRYPEHQLADQAKRLLSEL